jgi:DNA-binding beta-propeller fold protein YncE
MQRYREPWPYYLFLLVMSMLVPSHSNNTLAQSLPNSHDQSLTFSDDLIDDDIELMEEIINQQREVEKLVETEPKLLTNGNNDNDDSDSVAAVDGNDIENDRNVNGYSSLPEKDKDTVISKREQLTSRDDDRKPTSQNNPSGSEGVYVVDYMNIRIQKFNDDGSFISKWGSEGTGDGQFGVPHGIEVDSSGHVYVADMNNCNVQKFDSEGNFLLKWGSQGGDKGQFKAPEGLAIDSSDNVYVADTDNANIQKFDSDGNFLLKWGSDGSREGQLKRPAGIEIDTFDNVYVTDAGNNRIQKFDSNGKFIAAWGSKGSDEGQLDTPHDIARLKWRLDP